MPVQINKKTGNERMKGVGGAGAHLRPLVGFSWATPLKLLDFFNTLESHSGAPNPERKKKKKKKEKKKNGFFLFFFGRIYKSGIPAKTGRLASLNFKDGSPQTAT